MILLYNSVFPINVLYLKYLLESKQLIVNDEHCRCGEKLNKILI
jgi:hypothetical protein